MSTYKRLVYCLNDLIVDGKPFNPQQTSNQFQDGDVFISCNFTRAKSYTKLFDGLKNLVFMNCNLSSVDLDPTWIIDDECSFPQNDYELLVDPQTGDQSIKVKKNYPKKDKKPLNETDKENLKTFLKANKNILDEDEKRIYKKELEDG